MAFYAPKPADHSKKAHQTLHAQQRAKERYGVTINVSEVVRLIQSGNSRALRVTSARTTVHRVIWDGVEMDVVYDKKRKTLATVLTRRNHE